MIEDDRASCRYRDPAHRAGPPDIHGRNTLLVSEGRSEKLGGPRPSLTFRVTIGRDSGDLKPALRGVKQMEYGEASLYGSQIRRMRSSPSRATSRGSLCHRSSRNSSSEIQRS